MSFFFQAQTFPQITLKGHVCVQCGGELLLGLAAVGEAFFDYVFLQPGSWGRFADLPVLK